ncbi:hypothetical protein [Polynucleobacter sp. CS-Odin-A6]|uniref:hypothetical protein n=1 Tax=Polynucleobacter sp. CS-Odin-A6 TaxID=2689106 RepID=UPI001C0BA9B9|nr:hypothetical protein [Polynucleobacter sp. CS-Odin-A6]MBU3621954.1 hypothetical protein [Polynucleobacter sp. CS-Odin-A6]
MKVLREFESHLFRQVNRYYKGLWQYNSLVTKIVTKATLRGGFSFGIEGLLSAISGRLG